MSTRYPQPLPKRVCIPYVASNSSSLINVAITINSVGDTSPTEPCAEQPTRQLTNHQPTRWLGKWTWTWGCPRELGPSGQNSLLVRKRGRGLFGVPATFSLDTSTNDIDPLKSETLQFSDKVDCMAPCTAPNISLYILSFANFRTGWGEG